MLPNQQKKMCQESHSTHDEIHTILNARMNTQTLEPKNSGLVPQLVSHS